MERGPIFGAPRELGEGFHSPQFSSIIATHPNIYTNLDFPQVARFFLCTYSYLNKIALKSSERDHLRKIAFEIARERSRGIYLCERAREKTLRFHFYFLDDYTRKRRLFCKHHCGQN